MKIKTLLSLLFCFAMLFSSCNKAEVHQQNPIIIAGKIMNLEEHKDITNFQLYTNDFFSNSKIKLMSY